MSKYFALGTLQGISSVKLDSKGCATVPYTVTNVSGRALDGRAVLISLPQTKPLSGPVEKGWVKIDGSPDRHFEVGKQETFTVNICVPPNSVAGNYTFRLDAVWVNEPDVGDEGPHLGFTVAAPTTTTTRFPLWLIPVLLVVVIGIGVGLWLALRSGGPNVPELVGMTEDAANKAVQGVGMTLDAKPVDSKPEDSGKILTQDPDKGQKATKGGKVQVTVGHGQSVAMVTVPPVGGQKLGNALVILEGMGLKVTPSFTGDTNQNVLSQSPPAGTPVPKGTSITLSFPPGSCVGPACYMHGDLAIQRMTIERSRVPQ